MQLLAFRRSTRWLTPTLVATAFIASSLTAPAAFADDTTSALSASAAPGWAPGSEVTSLRDRFGSTVRDTAPGRYISKVSSRPVNYQDSTGAWAPIDLSLKSAGGTLAPTASDFTPTYAALGSAAQLVKVPFSPTQSLSFGLTGARSAPASVGGSKVTYGQILPGVDEILETRFDGVKESLVLHSAQAASAFEFKLDRKNVSLTYDNDGSLLVLDSSSGSPIGRITTPYAFDSTTDAASGDPALTRNVTYTLDGDTLRLTVDPNWLNDPARVYPVTVDPSALVNSYADGTDDAYVQSSGGYSYNDSVLKSGTFDGSDKSRSYMHFSGANTFDGRAITSAALYAYENYSFSCTAAGVKVYPVGAAWNGTSPFAWPGPALHSSVAEVTVAHGYNSSCPAATVGFDVTGALTAWANNSYPNYGLALVASNEAATSGWKKWDSANGSTPPYLAVHWTNTAPRQAFGRSVSPNDCVNCPSGTMATKSSTPTITGNAVDPDEQTLRYDFEIYPGTLTTVDSSGNATPGSVARLQAGSVGGMTSGTTAYWTASTLADGAYSYRVRVYDGELYGLWSSGWVNFTVDSGPPAPPAINSSSHPSETVYYKTASIAANWLGTAYSGVNGYTTLLDKASGTDPGTSNPSSTTSNSFGTSGDGCYYLHARALNNVGTYGGIAQREMCVDTTAPSMPATFTSDHAANAPFNTTTLNISASNASDNLSGINGYSYLFNTSSSTPAGTTAQTTGSSLSTGTSSLVEGSNYAHIRAFDGAGNPSADLVKGPFIVDLTAPSAPAVTSPDGTSNSWTPNSTVHFSWATPSDASGISGYSYVFDTSSGTIPAASVNLATTAVTVTGIPDGTSYLHLRALDGAGNWGTTTTFTVLEDSTAPVAPTVSSSTHPNQAQWSTNNAPSLSFSAADLSGITGLSYVIDQTSSTVPDTTPETTSATGTASYTNLPEGVNYFHVRARNGSGLFGDTCSYLIRVDRSAPNVAPTVTSSSHQVNTASSNQVLQLDWTASPGSDAYSGIAGYSVAVNSSASTAADTTQDQTGTTFAYNLPGEGDWYFHIRALDAMGYVGGDTVFGPYKVDLTGPPAPTITSTTHTANVWSTATSASFAFTSSDTSGIGGYSVVFDSNAGTIPPTTVTTSTGLYSVSNITDGTHFLHVRAKDVTGNWGGSSLFAVLVDSTAPVAPAVSSSTHPSQTQWTTDSAPGFSFEASDTSGITGFSYVLDQTAGTVPDATAEVTGVSSSTASFSSLPDGLSYFHVRAVNGSGLFGATYTYVLRIDRSAPNVAPTASSSSHQVNVPGNLTTISLDWAGSPGSDQYSGVAGYSVALNDAAGTAADTTLDQATTSVSYAGLPEGSYYFHIRAVDAVGNVGPDTVVGPFVIDLTLPATPVLSADHSSITWSSNPIVVLTWPAPEDASGISGYAVLVDQNINGVPTSSVTTTSRSFTTASLPDGVSYIHVRARDAAGNWGLSGSYNVLIDSTASAAPTLTSSSHPSQTSWYQSGSPSLSVAAADTSDITGYAYSVDQAPSGDPGGTIQSVGGSVTLTGLPEGVNYVHARAINGSGLASAVTSYRIQVDQTAPTLPVLTSLTHEPGVLTNHGVVTVDWTDTLPTDLFSGVAGYSVSVNGDAASATDATVDQTASSVTTDSLPDGTYFVHVRPIDTAGNAAPDTTFGPIVIDAVHGLPYPVQDVLATAGMGSASVTWSPVDDNGSPVLGYTVVADPGGATVDVGPSTLQADFSGLENGTEYSFTVLGHNANGDALPSERSYGVVPYGLVAAPTDVVAEEVPAADAVHVVWTQPDLVGLGDLDYIVTLNPGNYRKTVSLDRSDVTNANDEADFADEASDETTISDVAPGTYTATVTAVEPDGTTATSSSSEPVTVQGLVPAAPSNVTAVPGDTEVSLSWPPAAGNGSPTIGYLVVNKNDGSTYSVDAPDTSTAVTGLTNGTRYDFDVYSVNELGQSAAAGTAGATPAESGIVAAKSAATPSNVRATRGDHSAWIAWEKPTATVAGVTSFQITSHPASGASKTWTAASSPATVTGLSNGVKVNFTVATLAASAGGQTVAGPDSNPSNTVRPAGLPTAPTQADATGRDSAARVAWTRPSDNGEPIRDYLVQVYTSSGSYVTQRKVGSSPQIIGGLTNGTSYYFTVRAENAVGAGPASNVTPTVLVAGPPTQPGSVYASQIGIESKLNVSWDASSPRGTGISRYVVTAEPGGRSVSVTPSSTSATLSGLRFGVKYTVHVQAYSGRGPSPTGLSNGVFLSAPPNAPTGVSASPGNKKATVSWTAGDANGSRLTGFTVYSSPYLTPQQVDPDARSVTFPGLTNGTSYTFHVSETNALGTSPDSASSRAVTPSAGSTSSSAPPSQPPKPYGGSSSESVMRSRIVRIAQSQDDQKNGAHEQEWPEGGNCNWFTYFWHRSGAPTHGTGGDPDRPSNYNHENCAADPHPPTANVGNGGQSENWCSDFAEWVYYQAGMDTSGADAAARHWVDVWGPRHHTTHSYSSEPNYTPKPGDLAVWQHHVAVVVGVSGTTIFVVGGNAGPNTHGTDSTGHRWTANVIVHYEPLSKTGSGYKGGHGHFMGFVSPVDTHGHVAT